MNHVFVNWTIRFIKDNTNYSSIDISKIKYGLEGIYLTLTKLFIITLIAIITKTLSLVVLTLIFFNVLRFFAFGLHAKKTWQCFVSSILFFNILPLIFTKITISNYLIIIICSISIFLFLLYAPSDTEKRPLNNKKKNIIRKIATIIISLIFIILIYSIDLFKIPILCALLIESIVINPISYKIMGVPFNNYMKKGGIK